MEYKDLTTNPVGVLMQLVGAKWKILIVQELLKKEMRFSALRKKLGCTSKVLIACLREMEEDGLVVREEKELENKLSFLNESDCNGDVHTITAEHFIEKDFETPFTDVDLLLKTLQEHGVTNINRTETEVFGSVDNYNLTFKRDSSEQPFKVRITCKENDNASEKIGDLSTEYAMNVQEDAYLHIVDKLKENNMSIEEEVVEDDNTIVLTVNIEQ